jgi:hypothetical protein
MTFQEEAPELRSAWSPAGLSPFSNSLRGIPHLLFSFIAFSEYQVYYTTITIRNWFLSL